MYDIIMDFKCGRTQYRGPVKNEKGEVVTPGERVSADDFTEDQRVRYVAAGWMAQVGVQPVEHAAGVVDLDIQNLTSATTVTEA